MHKESPPSFWIKSRNRERKNSAGNRASSRRTKTVNCIPRLYADFILTGGPDVDEIK